jgi:hypothetical protein
MMRWPWSDRVEAAVAKAEQAEKRAERVESQWEFIHEQLQRLRQHKAENGFTDKIHRVARGNG